MWFVFPQIAGLGQSETSRRYAIASRAEAAAYLPHALLGPRLIECTQILEASRALSATADPRSDRRKEAAVVDDALHARAPGEPVFGSVLERYFAGRRTTTPTDSCGRKATPERNVAPCGRSATGAGVASASISEVRL